MLTCACVCVCVYVCMCVYVYVYVCVCVCMYVYVCAWMQWKVWQCVDGVQYERCAVRGDGACLWHSLGVLLCGSAAAGERMRQQVCAFGMAMSDAAVDMHPLLVVEDELLVELGVADGGAMLTAGQRVRTVFERLLEPRHALMYSRMLMVYVAAMALDVTVQLLRDDGVAPPSWEVLHVGSGESRDPVLIRFADSHFEPLRPSNWRAHLAMHPPCLPGDDAAGERECVAALPRAAVPPASDGGAAVALSTALDVTCETAPMEGCAAPSCRHAPAARDRLASAAGLAPGGSEASTPPDKHAQRKHGWSQLALHAGSTSSDVACGGHVDDGGGEEAERSAAADGDAAAVKSNVGGSSKSVDVRFGRLVRRLPLELNAVEMRAAQNARPPKLPQEVAQVDDLLTVLRVPAEDTELGMVDSPDNEAVRRVCEQAMPHCAFTVVQCWVGHGTMKRTLRCCYDGLGTVRRTRGDKRDSSQHIFCPLQMTVRLVGAERKAVIVHGYALHPPRVTQLRELLADPAHVEQVAQLRQAVAKLQADDSGVAVVECGGGLLLPIACMHAPLMPAVRGAKRLHDMDDVAQELHGAKYFDFANLHDRPKDNAIERRLRERKRTRSQQPPTAAQLFMQRHYEEGAGDGVSPYPLRWRLVCASPLALEQARALMQRHGVFADAMVCVQRMVWVVATRNDRGETVPLGEVMPARRAQELVPLLRLLAREMPADDADAGGGGDGVERRRLSAPANAMPAYTVTDFSVIAIHGLLRAFCATGLGAYRDACAGALRGANSLPRARVVICDIHRRGILRRLRAAEPHRQAHGFRAPAVPGHAMRADVGGAARARRARLPGAVQRGRAACRVGGHGEGARCRRRRQPRAACHRLGQRRGGASGARRRRAGQ